MASKSMRTGSGVDIVLSALFGCAAFAPFTSPAAALAALFAALALLSGTVRVGEVRALISEQLQARFARARA